MAGPRPSLPPLQPSSSLPLRRGRFELYERTPRERLAVFLYTLTERVQHGWAFLHRFNLIPRNSVKDKLPYYSYAVAHPDQAVRLTHKQAHAVQLYRECGGTRPDTSRIKRRPHRPRDAFGPGMVFVVNTVLAWLMFSIDVRNAMLK